MIKSGFFAVELASIGLFVSIVLAGAVLLLAA